MAAKKEKPKTTGRKEEGRTSEEEGEGLTGTRRPAVEREARSLRSVEAPNSGLQKWLTEPNKSAQPRMREDAQDKNNTDGRGDQLRSKSPQLKQTSTTQHQDSQQENIENNENKKEENKNRKSKKQQMTNPEEEDQHQDTSNKNKKNKNTQQNKINNPTRKPKETEVLRFMLLVIWLNSCFGANNRICNDEDVPRELPVGDTVRGITSRKSSVTRLKCSLNYCYCSAYFKICL
ncbi:uncharacterized protein [Narcine bancroftii]|uniref:uncharacterized protein n=1 Tax=Narcine bancroftii TaxID=1343680 RepID=UPI0038313F08